MHDVRLAIRALRSTPVVAVVAVLSLALGIGANTTAFALANSLLLRALPVAAPDRLVVIDSLTTAGQRMDHFNYPVWKEVRRRPFLFEGALAWAPNRFNLASGGPAQWVDGLWASGSFFSTLGVNAAAGRVLTEADDRSGGGPDGPVAVIGDRFARRHFGGVRAAVGRTLLLDKVPFTVVGVTSPEFFGAEVGRTFDVIVPLGAEPLLRGTESWLERSVDGWLTIMARLRPGQSADAATAALRAVQKEIWNATINPRTRPEYRESYVAQSFMLLPAATGQSSLRERYERPVLAVMIVVALVLLIACANLANLLIGRAAARHHEMSVRLALGASRWRLMRQLLAESVVLAALGALGGLAIARWAGRLLIGQLSTPAETVYLDLSVDWRILAFTMAIAGLTVLLFGTAPALIASRSEPASVLRTTAQLARPLLASNAVVVAQVALSLVLVGAAALFIRTFSALVSRQLGFDRDRVLIVGMDSRRTAIAPARRAQIYDRVRDRVRAIPGVADAAVSMMTPVDPQGALVLRAEISGGMSVPNVAMWNAFTNVISPGWFRTLGVPLIAGRDFDVTDAPDAPRVAIVNETLARQFLKGASPIGRTITLTAPGRSVSAEIVGLVADAVYLSLRETVPPTVYTPIGQLYMSPIIIADVSLSVRAATSAPAMLTRSVTGAIASVNPELTLTFRPLGEQVNASVARERIVAVISGFFGALALLLAALGLYGVAAASAAARRTEVGIRIALGATPRAILRLVLSRVAWLVGSGVLVGSMLSAWASRFIAGMLYELKPRDPMTMIGSVVVLVATAAIAAWLPAWRASRLEPAEVLRQN